MGGGSVIRRARTRAGLTQTQLARMVATTDSALSRWEHGRVEPAYATVERCVAACGLTLAGVLREPEADPHDLSLLDTTLGLSIDERARRMVDFVRAVRSGRAAIERAS